MTTKPWIFSVEDVYRFTDWSLLITSSTCDISTVSIFDAFSIIFLALFFLIRRYNASGELNLLLNLLVHLLGANTCTSSFSDIEIGCETDCECGKCDGFEGTVGTTL